MSIQRDRLLSLIDFVGETARLRSKPTASVAQHGIFALYEHQIQGVPGIHVNVNRAEDEDEVWLVVERLHESMPPDTSSAVLAPWVEMTKSTNEEPRLRETVDGASLIAAGTHCSSAEPSKRGKPAIDPEETINLADFDKAMQVRAQLDTYVDMRWRPWAEEEKPRRRTIRLYSQLFALRQQLEGGIVDAQLELVWGVGIGLWEAPGASVCYPLVGRLVEMSLDPETASIEVRPRDVDARLEVDWYASVDNTGVAVVEKAAKEFLAKAETTFSPFDRGTFEAILRVAQANLDPNAIYRPDQVPPEDRSLPQADDTLNITDTWVLFARPRTNNVLLQDLEHLRQRVEDTDTYPPAVAAIVTDPGTANRIIELPTFRGVSVSYQPGGDTSSDRARDLYFPKPFNDEQVRILQYLEVSDGVVVQGPPGTGKSHTIANIICHYLAEGKRVLVTSMKDPALAVLQDNLPDEIRPLAISLLTSEQDGMKQFEHAIQKIASEVQGLDQVGTARDIQHLEQSIDALHGRLALIDRRIGEWADRNLAEITLGAEKIHPQDAAREVVDNVGQFEWIPDALGVTPDFEPQFTDADIIRLREARRHLGRDIDYLNASLPQVAEFPEAATLLQAHQDLSQFEKLQQSVANGDVPALADSSQETLTHAQNLLGHIEKLRHLRSEVAKVGRPWTAQMRDRLRGSSAEDLLRMLEALGDELQQAAERRKAFLARPVSAPTGVAIDAELAAAAENLAKGKKPFGVKGLLGRSEQKK